MSLEKLRNEIDLLDQSLLELLNKRATLSLQVLSEKESLSLSVYDANREAEVLERIIQKNNGPLTSDQIEILFQQIINVCRTIQQNHREGE